MTLKSYLEQLENYAEESGVELAEAMRSIGYQANYSRWTRELTSPRLEQARKVWHAITETAGLRG